MVLRRMLAVVSIFAVLCPTFANGQPSVNTDRGERLVRTWCAQCHAVGGQPQQQVLTDAPSFAELAGRRSLDETRLKWILFGPHPVMPNFPITGRDVSAIYAYLDRLRRAEVRTDPTRHINIAASPVERGEQIAQQQCAACHAIRGDGPSKVADAPPFSTLSQSYPLTYLEEALAEGIAVSHPEVEMPEFIFDPDDIGALILYLESVQAPTDPAR